MASGTLSPPECCKLSIHVLTQTDDCNLQEARQLVSNVRRERDFLRWDQQIEAKPRQAHSRQWRSKLYTRYGLWGKAATDAAVWLEIQPNDRSPWARTAEYTYLSGNLGAWKAHCLKMLAHFNDTNDPRAADSVCKATLLQPGIDVKLLPTAVLKAAAGRGNNRDTNWFRASSALIAYRTGEFEESLEWSKNVSPDSLPEIRGLANSVQAMAHYALGNHQEARRALQEAESLIPEDLRELGTDAWNGTLPLPRRAANPDWYIAEILRQEAAELISGE